MKYFDDNSIDFKIMASENPRRKSHRLVVGETEIMKYEGKNTGIKDSHKYVFTFN